MKKLTILFGLVMTLALALPGGAHAATFTVDTTADAPDANPGDGVCDDGAGNCTLRAAIDEANALAGADTIALPVGTYTLTDGQLQISDDLTISGAGQATSFVDGGLVARVFFISSVTVDISGVTIQNGAIGNADGGGIINLRGSMTLTDVTVSSNSASSGGGITNVQGSMTLTNVTVSSNTAANSGGGGILNVHGVMTLTNVTVSDNSDTTFAGAGTGGGGITNVGAMELTNVTVSGNSTIGFGGGIVNGSSLAIGGVMTLTNVTVSGNTARVDGGGIFNGNGAVTLYNSIIANSTPDNCAGSSAITSGGHNLEGADSCGFTAPGDLTNTDPLLGPLQDNGGTTETHALLPGSPAIDAIPVADCTDPLGNPITTDQRGVDRPQGTACDIGAYEFEPPVGGLVVDLDEAPLSAAQSSGSSAGQLAGTIAGVAALAVALASAAWYIRRRVRT